jgi:hypothetical protein
MTDSAELRGHIESAELLGQLALAPAELKGPRHSTTATRTNECARMGRVTSFEQRSLRLGGRVRLRVLRSEVRERFLRLLVAQNPGRTLRLDRTRERSAKIRPNDLAAKTEFVRQFLWPIGLVRHVCVTSPRSFVHRESIVAQIRSNERSHSFVLQNLYNVKYHPPCHPPRGRI